MRKCDVTKYKIDQHAICTRAKPPSKSELTTEQKQRNAKKSKGATSAQI